MEYNELRINYFVLITENWNTLKQKAIKQKMDTRQKGGYINQRTVRDVN